MEKISARERQHVPRYDDPQEIKSGRVEADPDRCTHCTLCAQVCPAVAIVVKRDAWRMQEPSANECVFCGACMAICPTEAIRMVAPDEFTGYYKTIDRGPPRLPRLSADW